MKKSFFILIGITSLAITSCDFVNKPLDVSVSSGGNTGDSSVVRKVLVEDYTGHECGNCPHAADEINNTLIPTYGNKVIPIAVHAGSFAEPAAVPFDGDFRTNAGDAYDSPTFFDISGPNGNPNGMINRIHYNLTTYSHVKAYSTWGQYVDSLISVPADAKISLNTTYNVSSRTASISVESKFLSNLSGNYRLCLLLTQDSIIAAQKFYYPTTHVEPNYVHQHVLRDAINGIWGTDVITTGSATTGQIINNSYSYSIPTTIKNIPCDDNHCHIVAFIYNTSTYEVIQVEEAKVIE